MSVQFYMDEHVPGAITGGLRDRGVDVLTVQEDGYAHADDEEVLDRALAIGSVVFTRDSDFLVISTLRQREGVPFAGVVYGHQLLVSIGMCVRDLELMGLAGEPEDFHNRVYFLPL